jgi:transcriptional regulator with XRE-family HTH domain
MSTVTQFQNAESIDAAVGRRVHSLMWQQRVKNKDIAELLGLEATGIGKKLRAEAKFSIEQLVLVAARLNTTVSYLVGESDAPHPVGPAGIEPTTSTVKAHRLAPVIDLASRRAS